MSTSHLAPRTLCLITLGFFCFIKINAQRLEVHVIKDFSTDNNANSAWGVGGAIEFDQLVKNVTFKVNFDWATFKQKADVKNSKYQRMSGGIAAGYFINFAGKATFQCGAEINYYYLKHSFIYSYDIVDSLTSKPLTLQQTGGFIGVAPYIGLLYKLTPRVSVALNTAPTYLIPVHPKSSVIAIEPEYNKGIWLFAVRLGFSFQLFNKDQ